MTLMGAPMPLNRRRARSERASDVNYFPTPPWATRALLRQLSEYFDLRRQSVWEPACGEGYMFRPLSEEFGSVWATDIVDRRATFPGQDAVDDFLLSDRWRAVPVVADWIITNPPFDRAQDFCELAIERARVGCAMLVKQQFLEGMARYYELYQRHWPTLILQFVERVPMVENRIDPDVSTNQSYIWVIWVRRQALPSALAARSGTIFAWIPPCRKNLERHDDYREVEKPAEPGGLFGDAPCLPPAGS